MSKSESRDEAFIADNKDRMTAEERLLASIFGLSDDQMLEIKVRTPEDKSALLLRAEADRLNRREELVLESSNPELFAQQTDLLQSTVDRSLQGLTPIEASVLKARFGLDTGRQRSQAETALEVSRHKRTVQRIEARALTKLRTIEEGQDLRTLGRILDTE